MGQRCTTQIQMDEQLAHRLDAAAAKLHRRKSGIIVHAIETYLDQYADVLNIDKAREQSLLTNRLDKSDEVAAWEALHDTHGWQV
ncbi:MAG: hypothetical protein R8J84_04385 [Mariprofundales bacterium]